MAEQNIKEEAANLVDAFSGYNQHGVDNSNGVYISKGVPEPPFYKRKVGRFYVCWERRKEESTSLLCMVGPCWPMIFVVVGLIVGIALVVDLLVIPQIDDPDVRAWLFPLAIAFMIFTVITYLLTAFSNPGIQPIVKEQPSDNNWTLNSNVQSYRPPGVNFEYESQTLIKKIDHFCPWTGTVIAENNMKRFIVFNCSVCGLIVFTIGIVVGAFIFN